MPSGARHRREAVALELADGLFKCMGDAPSSGATKTRGEEVWLMSRRYGHCSTKNIKKLVYSDTDSISGNHQL